MDYTTFDRMREQLHVDAFGVQTAKRPGYTIGSPDVLANFKRVAERTGMTPLQVAAVYFLKHVDAITSAICKPALPQSEALEGRIHDALNYLDLIWGLVVESQGQTSDLPQRMDDAEFQRLQQLVGKSGLLSTLNTPRLTLVAEER